MRGAGVRITRSRRGIAAAVVTGVPALTGVTCVGVAVTHRGHARPPPSTVDSVGIAPRQPPSASGRPRPASTPREAEPVVPGSAPLSLAIPAIGVSSPLQQLGLTAEGALKVPSPGPRYDQAGWYRYSPAPGSVGAAVIVGHLDSAADGPSVFFRLASLRQGDRVLITRADASVAVFVVDEVRSYPKSAFPTQRVYGDTDDAVLRLITCGGSIDRESGHYLDNVIVFASLERLHSRSQATVGTPGVSI